MGAPRSFVFFLGFFRCVLRFFFAFSVFTSFFFVVPLVFQWPPDWVLHGFSWPFLLCIFCPVFLGGHPTKNEGNRRGICRSWVVRGLSCRQYTGMLWCKSYGAASKMEVARFFCVCVFFFVVFSGLAGRSILGFSFGFRFSGFGFLVFSGRSILGFSFRF